MTEPREDHDRAYEDAVRSAWHDPAMQPVVERAFLHEDIALAFEAFLKSEDWARCRRLLEDAGVAPGARVLDLGGGRGLLAAALADHGYEATLFEPNSSPICGTRAAVRLRRSLDRPFEVAADALGELPAQAFHAVVCRAVLHHVESLGGVLTAVRRVLIPGAPFIATDEPTVHTPEEMENAQERHPFARYGVQENAHPVAYYASALSAAGFVEVRSRFPVAFRDYLAYVRPHTPKPFAVPLYARYRLRSRLRPTPGQVVSLTARRPSTSGGESSPSVATRN